MDSTDPNKDSTPLNRGGSLEPQTKNKQSEDELEEEIDRDIDESFPASDPPGWVLGTERSYDSEKSEKAPDAKPQPSRQPSDHSI